MKKLVVALMASSMLGGCMAAPERPQPIVPAAPLKIAVPEVPKPAIGTFGFDQDGMDKAIAPGDDFFAFANGVWAKNTEIPADRSGFGMFTVLDELSLSRTLGILKEAAAQPDSKIGALYASFMDEAAIEARGIETVKPALDAIAAITTRSAYARALGGALRDGVNGPFEFYISIDDKNPDARIALVYQNGLGLPDRDYYLKSDPKILETKAAYLAYLTKLFDLSGAPDGAARAKAVLGFEAKLAAVHWNRIDSRDSDKSYNPWTPADFAKKAPGFDWSGFLASAGVADQGKLIVAQPSAITGEAKIIAATPLAILKDHLWLQQIDAAAPWLSKAFVETHFAFHGTTLSGTPQLRDRWKRGVDLVKNAMGEAIGQEYVARYFPPETKAAADQLVKNVIAAMGDRIRNLGWMDPATKEKALAKLAAFRPKIGYPDTWRDYSGLTIDSADLYGNVRRSNAFDWQRNLDLLNRPADRTEWFMTPMEINAYANPTWNEIVFPAAILQPPFFDPKADPAINYGGIGAVIGHEISHHFDDQGRKYDMHGRLSDWWTAEDVKRFTALTDQLVKQYDAYEPLPGLHVQGGLTLGENIADLAGLTVAHEAYRLSLGGKEAPVIEGYSGDQRFYMGWAQVWRFKAREASLRQRLLTDPHSPAIQRVWVVRNLDPFYSAYGVDPAAKLFLAPTARVKIW